MIITNTHAHTQYPASVECQEGRLGQMFHYYESVSVCQRGILSSRWKMRVIFLGRRRWPAEDTRANRHLTKLSPTSTLLAQSLWSVLFLKNTSSHAGRRKATEAAGHRWPRPLCQAPGIDGTSATGAWFHSVALGQHRTTTTFGHFASHAFQFGLVCVIWLMRSST